VRVACSPGVYVPRWQTEPLVRRAVELLSPRGVAVDLCTGTGAIAKVLSARRPLARVVASDCDPVAVACARSNGVEAYLGDLDAPLPAAVCGHCDLVVAVPPYVPSAAIRLLPRDAREHEPLVALDGGHDGCRVLVRTVGAAARLLRAGGTLLCELGGDEPSALAGALARAGFISAAVLADEDGEVRGIEARAGSGAATGRS
jgi:release factor glutamine methyltransferase